MGFISFEEFKLQKVKYWAFMLGYSINSTRRELQDNKTNDARIKKEYDSALDRLLLKYSIEGKTIFEEVKDLKEYDGYTGIYILCFDEEMGYYIGQTNVSFKKRILDHFRKSKSQFDHTHYAKDVSHIYVLHATNEFMDWIECDCIASIPQDYLLNVMAGGPAIDLVKSKRYNSKKYTLNDSFIEMVVESVQIARKFNEDNISLENELKEGKKAVSRIKKMKDKNKTISLCKQAVKFDSSAIEYVPTEYLTKEFCYEMLEYTGDTEIVKYIPIELLDKDYVMKLVKCNRWITKFLPLETKTREVMEAAGYKRRK